MSLSSDASTPTEINKVQILVNNADKSVNNLFRVLTPIKIKMRYCSTKIY